MKIDQQELKPGIHVIAPVGEVDMSSSPELRDALLPVFKKRPAHVVVDLAGVPYIDSSGIATLVEGLQLSRKGGVRFSLVGANASVMAVFELAYLRDVFEMATDMTALFSGEKP